VSKTIKVISVSRILDVERIGIIERKLLSTAVLYEPTLISFKALCCILILCNALEM